LINAVRVALRVHKRVLLQAPTGAGKTALTVYMMGRAAEQGLSSMFIVHQNELLSQTSRALWEQKLEHGMIASGRSRSRLPAQVASVQTLVRRLDRYDEPRMIIIDECHRSAAKTYQRVLDAYPNALVVGLTATPQRTDGKGLSDTYDALIEGPSIRQLIDAGYLCDYEIFAPPSQVDISTIKTRAGDYAQDELEAAMDRPTITGDAVATYRKHARGKRCVVMCVSLKHAEHVRDSYAASGVPAEMIEGGMTNREREAVLERFRRGDTLVICNVQLLIEGVDIPSIEVVQWLRPTQSLIIWMQGNGRGLRPSAGKDRLLILDQVGNWHKHGLPDDDREWSLEGRKGRRRAADDEADVSIQQCQQCFAVFRTGVSACPSCGAPVEVRKKAEIQVVEGELERIDVERQRKERKREQGSARTIRELVALGVRREMRKPAAWAAITAAARQGRKPTPQEFNEARKALKECSE
jgi:superfamily II DNA or RNA helicase